MITTMQLKCRTRKLSIRDNRTYSDTTEVVQRNNFSLSSKDFNFSKYCFGLLKQARK